MEVGEDSPRAGGKVYKMGREGMRYKYLYLQGRVDAGLCCGVWRSQGAAAMTDGRRTFGRSVAEIRKKKEKRCCPKGVSQVRLVSGRRSVSAPVVDGQSNSATQYVHIHRR